MKNFLFFILLVFPFSSFAYWDLNDVSYLMPLPQRAGNDGLLHYDDAGPRGALLSDDIIKNLPNLTDTTDADQTAGLLRVMGVRIDPCFPRPTPQSCQKQLRLVWQGLFVASNGTAMTLDAAVHSFYVLSDAEFSALLQDILVWKNKWRVQTQGKALQVHPAWQTDHDASLKDFKKIVLKYAGLQNISRVTVMALRAGGIMWSFSGFDFTSDGQMQEMLIPRLSLAPEQDFVNNMVPFDQYRGGIGPKPQGADTINNLITNSDALNGQDQLVRDESIAAAHIENPLRFNPENMDCVSCHTAQGARQWGLQFRQNLHLDVLGPGDEYQNARYNLSNNSAEVWNTHSLRAFGYFDQNIAISQRTINESAAVADAINALVPIE